MNLNCKLDYNAHEWHRTRVRAHSSYSLYSEASFLKSPPFETTHMYSSVVRFAKVIILPGIGIHKHNIISLVR